VHTLWCTFNAHAALSLVHSFDGHNSETVFHPSSGQTFPEKRLSAGVALFQVVSGHRDFWVVNQVDYTKARRKHFE
jgi:hypothetical protein